MFECRAKRICGEGPNDLTENGHWMDNALAWEYDFFQKLTISYFHKFTILFAQ